MEQSLGLNDLRNQSTKHSQRYCPLADLSDAAGALRTKFIVVVFAAFSVVVAAWAAADVDVFAAHWTCTFVTPYRVLLDDRRCDHLSAERTDALRLGTHDGIPTEDAQRFGWIGT